MSAQYKLQTSEHPYKEYPCIECVFCKRDFISYVVRTGKSSETDYRCRREIFNEGSYDPVFGIKPKTTKIDRLCIYERDDINERSCGKYGKYWKPKKKKNLFKLLKK